ncbi:MAG TPA: hypothetical protein VIZ60_15095, partial [Rubrobacter sp.]
MIAIMATHKSHGYLIRVGNLQLIGCVVAAAVLMLAVSCAPERPPRPPSAEVLLAAGDIANCRAEGDDATAELVEVIDGTVLALGDEAYPRGTAANFEDCYGPSWGRFEERTKPVP